LIVSSRSEGFGLPALEAMACGTPVVAFDNSSLPEVVGEGGLLVPDGDVAAMSDAVSRVIDDQGLRRELSERGPAWSARFPWRAAVDAYAELLKSVAR
jgi:glycosyltransferase involved in cell wall biosynthesis